MNRTDAVIVVTGAASGIGAALATRFADEQPAAVVLIDRDEVATTAVATQIRDNAPKRTDGSPVDVWAVGCDVSDEHALADTITAIMSRNGPVDLFCANAGIGTGADESAPTDVWQQAWDVNVMAHVHACRVLVPTWLARGSGYLLITASAAGLLATLGDAPYSVTKHAAVAFAEWVSMTYGDSGIGVSCLCPQGVNTPLLMGPGVGTLATDMVKLQRVLEPADVAAYTAAAIDRDQFLILPHEEVAGYEQARATDRERWLATMRKLQAHLAGD